MKVIEHYTEPHIYSNGYRLGMNERTELHKLITRKTAKVGDRFNTIPELEDPERKQWEIVGLTDQKFSAVTKDDCIYVWCKYIGGQK